MICRFATSTIILAILITAFVSVLLGGIPQQAMKRESGPVLSPDLVIMPGDLHQALDWSLAYGDGRRVDWGKLGWEA